MCDESRKVISLFGVFQDPPVQLPFMIAKLIYLDSF